MTSVKPLWDAPLVVRKNFLQQYGQHYDEHNPRDYGDHEKAMNVVEGVLAEQDFDVDSDVYVTVQNTHTKMTFETADSPPTPFVASSFPTIEETVLIVNGWAFDRLEPKQRRRVFAHELCHVEANERVGYHDERHPTFQHLLSKRDAAEVEFDVIGNPVDFWEDYPVSVVWHKF